MLTKSMDIRDKISELRKVIKDKLTPLIDNDYVLLDLPYYENIGDSLIWEGEKEFLRTLPYKCLYYSSKDSFRYRKFDNNVIILLHGGGNFGDLYRLHSEFRKKIIGLYPQNRVILLPQTVYYENMNLLADDAKYYGTHPNVTICVRDQYSFDFLQENYHNKVILVPDMAFFLDVTKYKIPKEENRILFLKRTDKELVTDSDTNDIPTDAEIHDWPTYERHFKKLDRIGRFTYYVCKTLNLLKVNEKLIVKIEDWKRNYFFRQAYVQIGISFLSPYHTIYTTRLHVLILGVLLNKHIYLINNSSGKVINFYNTWLKELEQIKEM